MTARKVRAATAEDHRMADEAANDVMHTALSLLTSGGGTSSFGVQHVFGRIHVTVTITPEDKP